MCAVSRLVVAELDQSLAALGLPCRTRIVRQDHSVYLMVRLERTALSNELISMRGVYSRRLTALAKRLLEDDTEIEGVFWACMPTVLTLVAG